MGCLRHLDGCLGRCWLQDGEFWSMLRHVGGKMATKNAKMSHHRRKLANPRGFAGLGGGARREIRGGTGRSQRFLARGVARNDLIT